MDFRWSGLRKKRTSLNSNLPRVGNKIGITLLQVFLLVALAIVVMGFSLAFGAYQQIIAEAPKIEDVNIMPNGYATFIYDVDGNAMQKLSSSSGNRVSIGIEEIPLHMQHAIVAIEDERFYTHNGVDPHGMVRALVSAVSSAFEEAQGASTITQQLIKNNVFTDWMEENKVQRIRRKIQEQHLAVELEKSLWENGQNAKDVILENYLNTINLGSGAYGVQTAAQNYFGKNARDLTLSECAVIAAIAQNPSRYNPKVNPEENAVRMKMCLDYMLEQGYITKEEHAEAVADKVYDRIQEYAESQPEVTIYSWFVDEVIEQVRKGLMEQKGYSEVQADNAIYSGGLKIYSTEDPVIQKIVDEEFQNPDNFPESSQISLDWALTLDKANGTRENYSREMMRTYFRQKGDETFDLVFDTEEEAQAAVDEYKEVVTGDGDEFVAERTAFIPEPQAAMTIIDQSTGYVKAVAGGRGKKTGSLTLNRATDSLRQPGSTFKILSTYGPALELGDVSLATLIKDEAYKYDNGEEVLNADEEYHGEVTVRTSIAQSYNVPAVKVITDITPRAGFEYLERLGFSTLVDDEVWDVLQPLSLGAITNGVSNLELTAAYAAIANGGTYISPVFYTRVEDRMGNVLLENYPHTTKVFREATCWLLTSAMEDVVNSGTGADFKLNNMHLAGKTGTTTAYKDLIFAGFTPYYTAAIWAGYDVNAEMPEEFRNYHKTLWKNIMNRINEAYALEDRAFEPPSTVERLTVCSKSGLLAGIGCETTTEYFDNATAPMTRCTQHKPTPTPTPKPTPKPTPTAGPTLEPTPVPTPEVTPEGDGGGDDGGDGG